MIIASIDRFDLRRIRLTASTVNRVSPRKTIEHQRRMFIECVYQENDTVHYHSQRRQ